MPHSLPMWTVVFLSVLAAFGERTETGERGSQASSASLIPVGANSDAYWVGGGPGIRAVALDPGAAPPATLTIRERGGWKSIPTILNRPSPALPVRAGLLRVYAGAQAGPEGEPPLFAEFRLPDTPGHYDIFLNRAANRDDWEKAESMILPASQAAFPTGSFRLINLSPVPIQWKIGARLVDLAPRRATVVTPPADPSAGLVAVQAAHADGEEFRILIRTGVRLAADQRANLVAYPGRDPKKPCEITWYYQSDPTPEPTPSEGT